MSAMAFTLLAPTEICTLTLAPTAEGAGSAPIDRSGWPSVRRHAAEADTRVHDREESERAWYVDNSARITDEETRSRRKPDQDR